MPARDNTQSSSSSSDGTQCIEYVATYESSEFRSTPLESPMVRPSTRATGLSAPAQSFSSKLARSDVSGEAGEEAGEEVGLEVGKITTLNVSFEQESHSDCNINADEEDDEASGLSESTSSGTSDETLDPLAEDPSLIELDNPADIAYRPSRKSTKDHYDDGGLQRLK